MSEKSNRVATLLGTSNAVRVYTGLTKSPDQDKNDVNQISAPSPRLNLT